MKKEALKVYVDKDLLDWLRKEAEERHCSMAQLIRTLILEAMKKANKA